MIPLAFMGMLAIYSMIWTGQTYQSATGGYESPSGYVDPYAGDVNTTYASGKDFTATGLVLILSLAIAGGTIAGIHFLGSGTSETSQRMIFMVIMFTSLWGVLSIVSTTFILHNALGTMLWSGLTFMYVMGMASTAMGGNDL